MRTFGNLLAFSPELWLLVVAGYVLGSIPFGYLLVRIQSGGDIRKIGSGNTGATNVARAAGWSVGVATLILDTAKGFFAVWLIAHFSGGNIRFMMYAGLAAILGWTVRAGPDQPRRKIRRYAGRRRHRRIAEWSSRRHRGGRKCSPG